MEKKKPSKKWEEFKEYLTNKKNGKITSLLPEAVVIKSEINEGDQNWEEFLQFPSRKEKLKQKCSNQWEEFQKFLSRRKKLKMSTSSQWEEFNLFLAAKDKSQSNANPILPTAVSPNQSQKHIPRIKQEAMEKDFNLRNSEVPTECPIAIPNIKEEPVEELEINLDPVLPETVNLESPNEVSRIKQEPIEKDLELPNARSNESHVEISTLKQEPETEIETNGQTAVIEKSKRKIARMKHKKISRELCDPDLSNFVKRFREKRLELGFMQDDVAFAIGKLYGCDYSQTTISRFEAFKLSISNMYKLKPFLQHWMQCVDSVNNPDCDDPVSESKVSMPLPVCRKRKKRTKISDSVWWVLENHFKENPKPPVEELYKIASTLDLDVSVVKVWFANRRQKEKRTYEPLPMSNMTSDPSDAEHSKNFKPSALDLVASDTAESEKKNTKSHKASCIKTESSKVCGLPESDSSKSRLTKSVYLNSSKPLKPTNCFYVNSSKPSEPTKNVSLKTKDCMQPKKVAVLILTPALLHKSEVPGLALACVPDFSVANNSHVPQSSTNSSSDVPDSSVDNNSTNAQTASDPRAYCFAAL